MQNLCHVISNFLQILADNLSFVYIFILPFFLFDFQFLEGYGFGFLEINL